MVGNEKVTMTGVAVGVCANPVQKSPLYNADGSVFGTTVGEVGPDIFLDLNQ
jgi:hypothetical protein